MYEANTLGLELLLKFVPMYWIIGNSFRLESPSITVAQLVFFEQTDLDGFPRLLKNLLHLLDWKQ